MLLAALWGCARSGPGPESAGASRVSVAVETAGARAVVEEAAGDLDVGIRGPALGQLVRSSPEPAGGAWGQRAAFDPSPWVQREGVEALAHRLPEPASADLLLTLAEREDVEPYTRGLAALVLADQGDRRAAPAMVGCMEAGQGWRAVPCALAAARYQEPEGEARLRAALAEEELPLDLDFVAALGASGLDFLVPELQAAHSWVEEPLRVPVAAALFELDPGAGAPLLRGHLGDPEVEVRLEALDFLRLSEQPEAAELLSRAAQDGEVVGTYARLIEVARGSRGPELALAALAEPDREVRSWAVWALGEAASREWTRRDRKVLGEALLDAATDEDVVVVLAAARALGATGAPEELAALEGLLDNEFPQVRLEAGIRLLQLAGEG